MKGEHGGDLKEKHVHGDGRLGNWPFRFTITTPAGDDDDAKRFVEQICFPEQRGFQIEIEGIEDA